MPELRAPTETRARLFRALGDETRLRVLDAVSDGHESKSVTEVCEATGLEPNLVSHHLRCLHNCALVERTKDGRRRLYEARDTVDGILEAADEHAVGFSDGIQGCEVVGEDTD